MLDAKITELDLNNRRVKLSVKAAQIDEENLIAKFGEGATKSGATLKAFLKKLLVKKVKKKNNCLIKLIKSLKKKTLN